MTYGEMTNTIETALCITHGAARKIVEKFKKFYHPGRKEAITSVDASFTKKGEVEFVYTINGKKYSHFIS